VGFANLLRAAAALTRHDSESAECVMISDNSRCGVRRQRSRSGDWVQGSAPAVAAPEKIRGGRQ